MSIAAGNRAASVGRGGSARCGRGRGRAGRRGIAERRPRCARRRGRADMFAGVFVDRVFGLSLADRPPRGRRGRDRPNRRHRRLWPRRTCLSSSTTNGRQRSPRAGVHARRVPSLAGPRRWDGGSRVVLDTSRVEHVRRGDFHSSSPPRGATPARTPAAATTGSKTSRPPPPRGARSTCSSASLRTCLPRWRRERPGRPVSLLLL